MSIWQRQPRSPVATHESAGHPTTTLAEALGALRDAVQSHTGDGTGFDELRTPIQLLCGVARQDGVLPEQLLIEVKHTLGVVPELEALLPEQRQELRSRVVQLTINSYFGDGS